MPIRLLELVRKYPYTKGLSAPTTDVSLLPRPPFTTRLHDAFFVRIETELPYSRRKPSSKLHPLSLLADALSTKVEGEYADLWAKITTASKDGDNPSFSNIFTDDTIRFLSLVPEEPIGREVRSPTFSLISPVSPHRGSLFVDDADKSEGVVAGHSKSSTEFSPLTPLSPLANMVGSDWAQFSASGFFETSPNAIPLASTLLDTDIEKTTPPDPIIPLSRKSSKRSKAASPSSPRKSVDLAHSGRETSPEGKPEDVEDQKTIIKASQLQVIQLDEAFIDFWTDSLLDPISADWPAFIICKFKSSLVPGLTIGVAEEGQKQKTIQWLILEHVYTIRTPPIPSVPSMAETVRPRSTSPGSQSTSGKKRFSFWSVSRTASNSSAASHKGKKKDQELRVGEMGELLEEEHGNEAKESMFKVKSPIFRSRKSLDTVQKFTETSRKSLIKPAEEFTINEEATAAVAAVAAGVVVASAAVITNGLPKVETATTKAEVDHSTDIPAIEPIAAVTEVVVPSSEPIVKDDDIPISAAVVSTPEAKLLESENVIESTAIATEVETNGIHSESELQPKLSETEPGLLGAESIVANDTIVAKDRSTPQPSVHEPEAIAVEDVVETEGHVESDPISAAEAVPVVIAVEPEIASVTDAATVTAEAPAVTEGIEVEETVGILAQVT